MPQSHCPAGLIIIDIQGKLASMVQDAAGIQERVVALLKLCELQKRPVLVCEQMPEKLGKTHPAIVGALPTCTVYEKSAFNAMLNSDFSDQVKSQEHWAVTGIETHICVYQTVMGMLDQKRKISVLADATSSRNAGDRQTGLTSMASNGASLVSTEMLLYQWMANAESEIFREMLPVIKALPPFEQSIGPNVSNEQN